MPAPRTSPHRTAAPGRRAGLPAALVLAALLAVLWSVPVAAAAGGSGATAATGPPAALSEEECEALEDEVFGEGEERSEAELDELEDLLTESCEEEEGEGEGPQEPPAECRLRAATAQAHVFGARGRVRLVVHYAALAPTSLKVSYRLTGSRGSLRLRSARRRIGAHGVLRIEQRLSPGATLRALAARRFAVTLTSPESDPGCRRTTRSLVVRRRALGRHFVWLGAEPARRAAGRLARRRYAEEAAVLFR